jgi:hypothetical protein
MTYELAKQLKAAGFPYAETWTEWKGEEFVRDGYSVPFLHELIEACGDGYFNLEHNQSGWWAGMGLMDKGHSGKTPEEAVANLYLALHANKSK